MQVMRNVYSSCFWRHTSATRSASSERCSSSCLLIPIGSTSVPYMSKARASGSGMRPPFSGNRGKREHSPVVGTTRCRAGSRGGAEPGSVGVWVQEGLAARRRGMPREPVISVDPFKPLGEEPGPGHNRWHEAIEPAVEVDPGDTVVYETSDAFDGQLNDASTA